MKCFDQINVRLKTPIWSEYENKYIEKVLVPCGKCPACIERKIMEWSFRLDEERKTAEVTYFVTLTYDNEHVPLSEYGRMTLNKEHLKGYFKLLKQSKKRAGENYAQIEQHYYGSNLQNQKIKYYAVGEYGSKKKRPHYHAIIFNANRNDIERLWKHGSVDIQPPRGTEAMSYVAKYMYKRIYNINPYGTIPEFSQCSNGIGDDYIKRMKTFYKKNIDLLYTQNDIGIQIPMSKYIRHKLWDETTRKKQIPIIKANIQKDELENLIQYGEEGNNRRKWEQMKGFQAKIKRKNKDRKDT